MFNNKATMKKTYIKPNTLVILIQPMGFIAASRLGKCSDDPETEIENLLGRENAFYEEED
jgi:hypothetical protein